MAKVRRIDWSPDEYIAGTFGNLTLAEHGVYVVVLMQIYSRGGSCPNDIDFISRHFARPPGHRFTVKWLTQTARVSLDRLVELGKLTVSSDGQWLTNDRAEAALNKARERIHGAAKAGYASGKARRANLPVASPLPPHLLPVPKHESNSSNDLTRTSVRITNHHYESSSSSIFTGAARDPALNGGSGPRARRTETTKERMAALAALNRRKFLA